MQKTNDQLFVSVKNDDYLCFNLLFNRLYGRLCVFACRFEVDRASSEDIVQEVFLKVWTGRKRIVIRDSITSYLYRATKNETLNFLRKEKKQQLISNFESEKHSENQIDYSEYDDFLDNLKKCMVELPERNKQIFLLSRFDGLKNKEIASKLNLSEKTIKNHLWKSLQLLRACLFSKDIL